MTHTHTRRTATDTRGNVLGSYCAECGDEIATPKSTATAPKVIGWSVTDSTTGRMLGVWYSTSARGARTRAATAQNIPYRWLSAVPFVEEVADWEQALMHDDGTRTITNDDGDTLAIVTPEPVAVDYSIGHNQGLHAGFNALFATKGCDACAAILDRLASDKFGRSFPALKGDVVTQGHADYCASNGHATHKADGMLAPHCPRCGDLLPIEQWYAEREAMEEPPTLASAILDDELFTPYSVSRETFTIGSVTVTGDNITVTTENITYTFDAVTGEHN